MRTELSCFTGAAAGLCEGLFAGVCAERRETREQKCSEGSHGNLRIQKCRC